MISATILRNVEGYIYAFTIIDHGATDVCAAVSLLALNTANSIEALTDEPLNCEYDPEGGFLQVDLPKIKKGRKNPEVNILLEAMALGLKSVEENYKDELEVLDKKQ